MRGLSNGLCRVLKRKESWLPSGLRSTTSTFLSPSRSESSSITGWSIMSISPLASALMVVCVGDVDPFDTVEMHDLAAGEARRRLRSRLIILELVVDRALARPPQVLAEDERAGADGLVDFK